MVQPGVDGLDTPRTNVGDATYLSRRPDFDISQELSFQSPSKDANIGQQLRNGGRPSLRTPRGNNRAPFTDRRNLPLATGIGGNEFTPLLKSATRNTARQYGIPGGKENGLATPAFLAKIDEDMTPMPLGETSVYGASRNTSTYMENTPLPAADDSSVASTPMVMRRRGGDAAKAPLEDGNQLSLREQENVIDRIEKENFGLKLKIHFLEEALRKAGPGFSEAALKENTELKVDKVTMQRELQRYKKHLTSAEKDLEKYQAQINDLREKAKRDVADESQRAEMDRLRQALEDKEADIEHLQRQVESEENLNDIVEKLKDEVGDLEAEIRKKDNIITEHEDAMEELKDRVADAEEELKASQRRMVELEEKAQSSERLREAKDTIQDLEADVRRLENQLDEMKEKVQDAVSEKERAEADLEELQEEMANKSVVTKGLSRQVEEKISRLQTELDKIRQDYSELEEVSDSQRNEIDQAKSKLKEARQERDDSERLRLSLEKRLVEVQDDLNRRSDEKALLQTRHDALKTETEALQREMNKLRKSVVDLEENMQKERQHSLNLENDIRSQFKDEIDRLNDEISDLQAECREKDNLYDNDSEKWDMERQNLESERDLAEERAAGLQRTIEKLRDAEGALSSKETKLQDALQSEAERHNSEKAVLDRQIEELRQNLDARQTMLEDLRVELSTARDQLRQSQLDCQSQAQKAEALEDEVEILQSTIDEESEKAQQELERARKETDTIRAELNRKQQESGKARIELQRAQQECESLKTQIASLETVAASARALSTSNQESAKNTSESVARLKFQLADSTENLARVTKERQALQDKYTDLDIETASLRAKLAETEAEKDDLEAEVQRLKQRGEAHFKLDQEKIDLRAAKARLDAEIQRLQEQNQIDREELEAEIRHLQQHGGEDTFKLGQERLDLRTAKTTLEGELRRLKEENKVLEAQRNELETSLETELEKAAEEEDRLNQEIRTLQAKLRQASDGQELSNARRTIRELERRIEALETELAATTQFPASQNIDGNSELSILQRDLSAARKKELELLKHEASQKETIKTLKRQIADLERKAHEAAMDRFVASPSSHGGSAQKAEVTELRHQVTAAHQTAHALKKSLREAEQKAASTARELQSRLDEIEEHKFSLEQALEDAQIAAEESAATHDQTLKKYKHKLEKYRRERDELAVAVLDQQKQGNHNNSIHSEVASDERRDLHNMLRESQMAADKLDREVREQREALEELMAVEMSLRKKLDRARSERAAYRASAEKLQKDVKTLKAEKDKIDAELATAKETALVPTTSRKGGVDTDAIIRAAEAAQRRHEKEIRGMVMQMEWLKACWDREAKLRSDAAFAKRYLLLEVQIRDACNKADLAIINRIRAELNPSSAGRAVLGQLSSVRERLKKQKQEHKSPGDKLRTVLHGVRFMVRMQMGAKRWAKHDKVRQRLADCVEGMEKEERIRRQRDKWRAQQSASGTQGRMIEDGGAAVEQ
ncbi:myosin-7 [Podospora aff. communis PSN243]|uniref:Myosin-7 n=1 Tax=Podospora aff. communis PSN243 TaxID=3040156 RepID=A0AAV9GUV4_9PEZI|nr:myosin-7 [Podospora aff. communis PSN243]